MISKEEFWEQSFLPAIGANRNASDESIDHPDAGIGHTPGKARIMSYQLEH